MVLVCSGSTMTEGVLLPKGGENLSVTEFCVSWLHICRGVLLLQDMWLLQAFTGYDSNINSSAIARFYPTLGHVCCKWKCLWLAFCTLVLFSLSLFLLFAKTDFLELPWHWEQHFPKSAKDGVCLVDAALQTWEMGTLWHQLQEQICDSWDLWNGRFWFRLSMTGWGFSCVIKGVQSLSPSCPSLHLK